MFCEAPKHNLNSSLGQSVEEGWSHVQYACFLFFPHSMQRHRSAAGEWCKHAGLVGQQHSCASAETLCRTMPCNSEGNRAHSKTGKACEAVNNPKAWEVGNVRPSAQALRHAARQTL